jgi:ribosomal protein L37E
MINDIDILQIDEIIKNELGNMVINIEEYNKKIDNLKKILKDEQISERIKQKIETDINSLNEEINSLKNQEKYISYINDTSELIENYKKIISKPIKINFLGKKNKDENTNIFNQQFIKIARKYIDLDKYTNSEKDDKVKIYCKNCGEKKKYEIIDNKIFVCTNCGFQNEMLKNSLSYKDTSRVNISGKYIYERIIHFRDCMNQYQGKQNSTINKNVYDDVIEKLVSYGIILDNDNIPKETRFKKVTKEHILLFLKETEHSNHYEDVNLIFHNITEKKLDDISYLEQKLLDDFDALSSLYDKKFKNNKKTTRKSFINTQYVLYQLLKRHKHNCKKEDFNILKTLDRKNFHDDVCKELFQELGWNFTPSF